jgi:hypothetical protein
LAKIDRLIAEANEELKQTGASLPTVTLIDRDSMFGSRWSFKENFFKF